VLNAAYPTRDFSVDPPDAGALIALENTLRERVAQADEAVDSASPPANPSIDNCPGCPVRGLCSEYWARIAPDPLATKDGEWFDLEGVVQQRNGVRSWWIASTKGNVEVLLRTTYDAPAFKTRAGVRLLGVRRAVDAEIDALTVEMSSTTDVLHLA